MIIRTQANARIGIMGNPSNGFFGKTIAATINNFATRVTLWESPTLRVLPHSIDEPAGFCSLACLRDTAIQNSYYGGMRLLFATCKLFSRHCVAAGYRLPVCIFTLSYETDIPHHAVRAGRAQ